MCDAQTDCGNRTEKTPDAAEPAVCENTETMGKTSEVAEPAVRENGETRGINELESQPLRMPDSSLLTTSVSMPNGNLMGKQKYANAHVAEVDPLPNGLTKKRAKKVDCNANATTTEDNEFYQKVIQQFSVREGMCRVLIYFSLGVPIMPSLQYTQYRKVKN